MTEFELDELERKARTLLDPKEREEVLRDIAELRSRRSRIQALASLPPDKLPRRPRPTSTLPNFSAVQSRGLDRFLKLLAGAVAFLALCVSLVYLVLPIGLLLDGAASAGIYRALLSGLSAVALSGAVLHLLARRPREEREAIAQNPITRQFARRKFLLVLSLAAILALCVAAIVLIKRAPLSHHALIYVAMFAPLACFYLLNWVFWRCPNCGAPLPRRLWPSRNDRYTFECCPRCDVTLQYPDR